MIRGFDFHPHHLARFLLSDNIEKAGKGKRDKEMKEITPVASDNWREERFGCNKNRQRRVYETSLSEMIFSAEQYKINYTCCLASEISHPTRDLTSS